MDTKYIYQKMMILNFTCDDLGFSKQICNKLNRQGLTTAGKIANTTKEELLKIQGLGEKSCNEIISVLASLGITIKETTHEKRLYNTTKNYRYPNNLIADIFDIDPQSLKETTYSNDQLSGVAVALSGLTEQEETMILLRYKHSATFEQIGNYYGVSKERARQIINETLPKLRTYRNRILIQNGLNSYIEAVASKRATSFAWNEYKKGVKDGLNFTGKDNESIDKHLSQKAKSIKLQDVDLSVRSYNCLRRAGAETLGDVLSFDTVESIYGIRNLGRKSAGEIARVLKSFEICNDAWLFFMEEFPITEI